MSRLLLIVALAAAAVYALPQNDTENVPSTSLDQEVLDRLMSANDLYTQLSDKLTEIRGDLAKLEGELATNNDDINREWLLFGAPLVFAMQAGYLLLESGSVRSVNVSHVMLRITITAALVGVMWWICGFGFAFDDNRNNGTRNGFIGNGDIFLASDKGTYFKMLAFFLFTGKFAIEASTIATRSLAERARLPAYFIFTVLFAGFIYPVVAHWCWSTGGYLSPFATTRHGHFKEVGMIDLAGGAVVHLLGGVVAFTAAFVIGPRQGTFDPDVKKLHQKYTGHEIYQLVGSLLVWFGFFAFNAVSTYFVNDGMSAQAGKVLFNTTLGAATGGLVAHFLSYVLNHGQVDLFRATNGIIAGLVAVSSGAHVIEPWAAVLISALASSLFIAGTRLLPRLHIDDPVDTVSVHGLAGATGVFFIGWFARPEEVRHYYNNDRAEGGFFYGSNADLWGGQCIAILVITAWGFITTLLAFLALGKLGLLRVDHDVETAGIDGNEKVFSECCHKHE